MAEVDYVERVRAIWENPVEAETRTSEVEALRRGLSAALVVLRMLLEGPLHPATSDMVAIRDLASRVLGEWSR